METSTLHNMANAIRFLSADAINQANSGHPGMPLGMADVATVLFAEYIKLNPEAPKWFDRDRFVLSAGHGSMLLYSLLWLRISKISASLVPKPQDIPNTGIWTGLI